MAERTLTDSDLKALATVLIETVKTEKPDFFIDPEKHYESHSQWKDFKPEDIRSLHDLIKAYRSARGLFWRAFLGFAIIGTLVLVAIGVRHS